MTMIQSITTEMQMVETTISELISLWHNKRSKRRQSLKWEKEKNLPIPILLLGNNQNLKKLWKMRIVKRHSQVHQKRKLQKNRVLKKKKKPCQRINNLRKRNQSRSLIKEWFQVKNSKCLLNNILLLIKTLCQHQVWIKKRIL